MQRRGAVTTLVALAAGVAVGHERAPSGRRSAAAADASAPTRDERLAQAEALLAGGRVAVARDAFEQMAQGEHAADIELGIMRCQMQAGEYRTALAFAAHTAGAHPQFGAGAAFYAWLLHLGGQHAVALKTLAQAEQRLPGDPALGRVRALVGDASAHAGVAPAMAGTLVTPERLLPYALGEAVPTGAQVICNAMLLDGGRQAIAPLDVVQAANAHWLRNGLGWTVRARVQRLDPRAGLAVLEADQALEGADLPLAASEAAPGSPACIFGYPPGPARDGAWPRASLGFLGRRRSIEERLLGIEVAAGMAGAPVVNLLGRAVGIVLPAGGDGRPGLAGVATIRALAGEQAAAVDTAATANRPLDELYEKAMRVGLQVIAVRT